MFVGSLPITGPVYTREKVSRFKKYSDSEVFGYKVFTLDSAFKLFWHGTETTRYICEILQAHFYVSDIKTNMLLNIDCAGEWGRRTGWNRTYNNWPRIRCYLQLILHTYFVTGLVCLTSTKGCFPVVRCIFTYVYVYVCSIRVNVRVYVFWALRTYT